MNNTIPPTTDTGHADHTSPDLGPLAQLAQAALDAAATAKVRNYESPSYLSDARVAYSKARQALKDARQLATEHAEDEATLDDLDDYPDLYREYLSDLDDYDEADSTLDQAKDILYEIRDALKLAQAPTA